MPAPWLEAVTACHPTSYPILFPPPCLVPGIDFIDLFFVVPLLLLRFIGKYIYHRINL